MTDRPHVGGSCVWGAGNAIGVANANVVIPDTDAGLQGAGEVRPCGQNYVVAHSEGVGAPARLAAAHLRGEDPRQEGKIEQCLVRIVRGHGHAKASFDAACRDSLGQVSNQPVWMVSGGKLSDGVPVYRGAAQENTSETLAEMRCYRAEGSAQFQSRVGGDRVRDSDRIKGGVAFVQPGERAIADADQGWRVENAVRAARETADVGYTPQQPCLTHEACQQVRQVAPRPKTLVECITGLAAAQRIVADPGAATCCLKVSDLRGRSKARRVRGFPVEHRIPVAREGLLDGEISDAAVAHFTASAPPELRQNTTDLMNSHARSTGIGWARTKSGNLYASDASGMGVTPVFERLGSHVAEHAA